MVAAVPMRQNVYRRCCNYLPSLRGCRSATRSDFCRIRRYPNGVKDEDREVRRRLAGLGPCLSFALVFTLVFARLLAYRLSSHFYVLRAVEVGDILLNVRMEGF